MKIDERTMKLIEKAEEVMDNHNGAFGNAGTLCLFCGSNLHNGHNGITHKKECLIQTMRDWIIGNGGKLRL